MENLKALVNGRETTPYQRALALREFIEIERRLNELEQQLKNCNLQNVSGSAFPTLKEFSLGNFDNVAEIAQRLTTGNVAHHRNTIIGLAKRCSEFIRKHYS